MATITKRPSQIVIMTLLVSCAVACMTGPRKSPAERQADDDMVARVQAALSADQVLYSRHINVRADDGVVTLSGHVWTTEELQLARQDAQSVPGVSKVVDRMEVDRGAVQDSGVTR